MHLEVFYKMVVAEEFTTRSLDESRKEYGVSFGLIGRLRKAGTFFFLITVKSHTKAIIYTFFDWIADATCMRKKKALRGVI